MLAAGDIADCRQTLDSATAEIVKRWPNARVMTLGDHVYPNGTAAEFRDCYHPTWGQFKSRTWPAVGNHEYLTSRAAGYFGYFGSRAGSSSRGYYSYVYGAWKVIVLNSNFREGGPSIADTSAQMTWLRGELANTTQRCTMAYFHHPRFTSGTRVGEAGLDAAWRAMYAAGVDLIVVGHDHLYERLGPTNPDGDADADYGIRQFTVGVGGSDARSSYAFGPAIATSERRQNSYAGVLRLTLDSTFYRWQFLAVGNTSWTDTGRDDCHGAPPPEGAPSNAVTPLTLLDPSHYPGRRPAAPLFERLWQQRLPVTHRAYLARSES